MPGGAALERWCSPPAQAGLLVQGRPGRAAAGEEEGTSSSSQHTAGAAACGACHQMTQWAPRHSGTRMGGARIMVGVGVGEGEGVGLGMGMGVGVRVGVGSRVGSRCDGPATCGNWRLGGRLNLTLAGGAGIRAGVDDRAILHPRPPARLARPGRARRAGHLGAEFFCSPAPAQAHADGTRTHHTHQPDTPHTHPPHHHLRLSMEKMFKDQ